MKKKIINGILMVALVGATSTSFVSCKDNSEDVRTDLMAQITKARNDLEPRVQQAETDIDNLKNRVGANEDDIKYLRNSIAGIRDTLNSLEDFRDSVYEVTQRLDKRLDVVDYKINTLVETFKNLITSVAVNATSTSILENSKVFPGLNMQFLGAAYGKAVAETSFPSVADDELADGIKKFEVLNGQVLINEEKAAGTIYFTVNPSNIDATNLEKVKLSLVNSQAEENALLELGEITASKKVLTWGTRADGDAALWEAPVTIKYLDKLGKLEPATMINLEEVAKDVKDIVNDAQAALDDVNRSNYASTAKSATKNILKSASSAIVDLIQVKIPSLPALALKAQWQDTVGVRSVISDYSIAATAYKPVSFTWGKGVFEETTISLDKIDEIAARIVDEIKDLEPEMSKYTVTKVKNVNIEDQTAEAEVTDGDGTVEITIPLSDINGDLNKIIADLNKNLDMLNGAIDDVTNIIDNLNKNLDKGLSFENRVSNALERYINRVFSSLANNGFYQALQPILLVDTENGAARIVSGTSLKAGEKTLVATTVTNELLAPAFKKYVAVVNDNGVKGEVKTKGDADFSKFTVTLAKGKNTIIYSALDFYGNEIVKRYTVTAQ